ncbi:TPA: ISL3 family transposase [Staphylococcus aureus]|nr:ISL3 family transposase [Staphylococcus aureus]
MLKTFDFKDKNIIFDGKLEKIECKGRKCFFYYAKLIYTPEVCPNCNCKNINGNLIKNGSKTSRITMPKISEYPTYIMLRKQRFKCKTCERYFTAETPEVDKYCFISKKTLSAVLNKAAEIRSEKSIAKSCSVSATTVSRIIDEAAQSLHQSPYSALPEHIMMDEFKSVKNVSGKMSFIYADAQTHHIIDIVEDRRLSELKKYFYRFSLKARKRVKTVSIDMHEGYMTLIKEMFPNAKIVIDRFHIVQLLNRALNGIRVAVMNELRTKNQPLYNKFKRYAKLLLKPGEDLEAFEYRKVALFKEWKTQKGIVKYLLDQDDSLNDAYQYINQLRFKLKHNDYEGFIHELKHMPLSQTHSVVQRAIKTLNKHAYFIKNTFDYYNLSNGSLEGINNKIKLIKRTSFGYGSYNHLRNRILLCSKLYAPQSKKEVKQCLVA